MSPAPRSPEAPVAAERGLSRRSLAKGAAWSVPVIAVGAPAAYAAASATVTGSVCKIFYADGSISLQQMEVNLGLNFKKAIPAGSVVTWTVTADRDISVPAPAYSPDDRWTLETSVPKGTKTRSFTVTFTAHVELESWACGPTLAWTGSGDKASPSIGVGTQITVAATTSGAAIGSASQLTWTVPKRQGDTNERNPQYPVAMRFLESASGCYPVVRYKYRPGRPNSDQSTASSTCGDGYNNSSTIYPDGTCRMVVLETSGTEGDVAAVC